ncbi:hypothetical protein QN277_005624 [Acacia crassicarpa]|uniref:TIR domain-containing protein n=1 Tax=Acacia crassicarpa TaxID=499986 RepID=A0AAE1IYM6_9FABA|nr:hypothetical protein QN277_005624 [Acacia crassicarpa]
MMRREASLLLLGLSIYKAIRFISHLLNGNQPGVVDDSSQDNVILAQTASASSSHIVVSPPATKYDVFLSFRGEDTHHTFASYLYKGLCNADIHTFMDCELHKEEHISQVLFKTIEKSEISMIIFSESYASSAWCLDELVHILECKEKFGRVVIPIFYNIDPSNLRKQNESFEKGFNVLKKRFSDNLEKLQKWSDALYNVASLSGWDSNTTRSDVELVEEIVKDILSKLKYESSCRVKGLVGIARHMKNVKNLLTEARIVGIWGMGGAGKTTLAKVIFQELRAQFDVFSFIENVKEKLQEIGLDKLQQHYLKKLLKGKENSVYDIKPTDVKKKLGSKKILLILDDVDDSRVVEHLTKLIDWVGEGSRVIITSRDMQVLRKASSSSTYHVLGLEFYKYLRHFSLKAFKQHEPFAGYMDLSISMVRCCQRNPLALDVLGCFLYGRGKEVWESTLEKLDEHPPKDIVDILKLSFDGLDEKQQNVFLDLAFLIKERVDVSLNLIRQFYDSCALIEITSLEEKSLISFAHHGSIVRKESLISHDHHCPFVTEESLILFDHHCSLDDFSIVMHDLVKKMGLELAEQQLSFANPRTLVRLWKYEDIDYFFSCGKKN